MKISQMGFFGSVFLIIRTELTCGQLGGHEDVEEEAVLGHARAAQRVLGAARAVAGGVHL